MLIMKHLLILVYFTATGIILHGQSITKLDGSKIDAAVLSSKIESLIKGGNVHGLAVSIFNNNEPV